MELTRRDALVALAAGGTIAGGATAGRLVGEYDAPTAGGTPTDPDDEALDADTLATLVAAAEVVFPSSVTGHREFVETYVLGRIDGREDHREGIRTAATELEDIATNWYDASFESLAPDDRDRLLRELGVDAADPDPEGTVSERVRFYVVNDLLYAFYSSPPGGRLVGIENPIGYPGGTESYQRAGPDDE